jgi:hypothetical protein
MPPRGQIVIVAIFLTAVVAGVAAIAYHRGRAARPLELWGRDAAVLIVQSPRAAALRLSPDAGDRVGAGETLEVDGQRYFLRERRDITGARGLVNIRRALVDDSTFDWTEQPGECSPEWVFALEFHDDAEKVTMLFSFDCPRARLLSRGTEASIGPTSDALRSFMAEQFAPDVP